MSEPSHGLLNPAYYPKDLKPEAVWTEAEKSGEAESPNDSGAPTAANTDENVELPESYSDEAVAQRKAEFEEMANKDKEAGSPVVAIDPEKARSAEEGEKEAKAAKEADSESQSKGKVKVSRRK